MSKEEFLFYGICKRFTEVSLTEWDVVAFRGHYLSEAREARVLIVGSNLVHRPFTSAFRRSAYVDDNCTD
jgi:hypothetical protein